MNPAEDILRAVRATLGDGPKHLQRPPVERADFIVQGDMIGQDKIDEFEARLAALTRTKHAVALGSGTAALHASLVAAGVGHGDEVLCPSLTFVATANAILAAGAVPHFVDVNCTSFGVHPFKLRQYLGLGAFEVRPDGVHNIATGRRLAAMVPVHLLGMPCQIDELVLTATFYGIAVIEDAAEALGARTHLGAHVGTVGKAGILSFNLNKIITTGGGGAVITNDEAFAKRVRQLSTQAKVDHPFLWNHDGPGFNYRMSPLCAALGNAQMKKLPRVLEEKAKLSGRYCYHFNEIQSATLKHGGNNWLNCALIDPRCLKPDNSKRDEAIKALLFNGFESRAMFTPLHMLNYMKQYPRQQSLQTSEDIFRRAVCLPSSICVESIS